MKLSPENQDRLALFGVLIVVQLCLLTLHLSGELDAVEWWGFDRFLEQRNALASEPHTFTDAVVPVAIDDHSVNPQYSPLSDTWGRGGWLTRENYVLQMQMYADWFKPAVVAYDLNFAPLPPNYKNGTHPAEAIMAVLFDNEGQSNQKRGILEVEQSGNQRMGGLVSSLQFMQDIQMLFGMIFHDRERPQGVPFDEDGADILSDMSLPEGSVRHAQGATPAYPVHRVWELPMDALLDTPAWFAPINLPRERDGVTRRLSMLVCYEDAQGQRRYVPSFTLMSLLLYLGVTPDELTPVPQGEQPTELPAIRVNVGEAIELFTEARTLRIPVDDLLKLHLNPRLSYSELLDTERVLPYVEVSHLGLAHYAEHAGDPSGLRMVEQLEQGNAYLRKDFFNDKLMLIFPASTQSLDLGNFSLEQHVPNAFAYMVAFDSILNGDYLQRVSAAGVYSINALLILLIALPQLCFRQQRIYWWIVVLGLVYYAVVAGVWHTQALLWPLLSPLLGLGLLLVAELVLRFFRAAQQRLKLRGMFSTVVSKEILHFMEENPDRFKLTGERLEATMFFSDVAGFTSFSEKLTPEALADLLNRYLTPMTDLILQHRGYLDKYAGDGIMAVWGVPYPDAEHAKRACISAVEQQRYIDKLAVDILEETGIEIFVRMGLNSGEVSAGNMGSERKFQYTVMGDPVNLAARLEPVNKDYGSRIMLGEKTHKLLDERFHRRLMDKLVVKGKTEAISIYELADFVEDGRAPEPWLRTYEKAFEAFCSRKWDEAEAGFKACMAEREGGDVASELMLSRLELYRETPPPEGWQGEFVRVKKD